MKIVTIGYRDKNFVAINIFIIFKSKKILVLQFIAINIFVVINMVGNQNIFQ